MDHRIIQNQKSEVTLVQSVRRASTVVFGVLFVMFFALWVRSYWWFDQFSGPISNFAYGGITSVQGQSTFEVRYDRDYRKPLGVNWKWRGFPMSEWENALNSPVPYFPAGKAKPFFSFTLRWPRVTGSEIVVPYWIPLLLSGSVAALPWMTRRWVDRPCRFSLRAMLIATTVLAFVLGMVCYTVR